MKKLLPAAPGWFALALLTLCGLAVSGAAGSEPLKAAASICPQRYVLEKIGGSLVDVSVMVEPGASPHLYEPKPKQMAALSKAKIYFAIGVEFEKAWLERFARINPRMRIVHTEAGIEKRAMESRPAWRRASEKDDARGAPADHPGGRDPHVWLAPHLVMIQARNALTGLIAGDPAHAPAYEDNYRSLVLELVELDREIRGILAGAGRKRRFVALHPSWGYFASAYGLEQIPVEIEGKEPKPAELGRLIRYAKELGIDVVFAPPRSSSRSAGILARAIGGRIVIADPLACDWAANLRSVAAKFRSALR